MNARLPFMVAGVSLAAFVAGRYGVRRSPDFAFGVAADQVKERRLLAKGAVPVATVFTSRPVSSSEALADDASHSTEDRRSSVSFSDEEALLRLLDEARRQTEPLRRREQLTEICLRWAGFDPAGAIRLALELELDPLGGALLPNLAQQWAAKDIDAVRGWARSLPPGELRDDVYSRIIYEQATRSPSEAAKMLGDMRSGTAAHEEAALTILHLWAQQDPGAARAWVTSIGLNSEMGI